MRLTILNTVYLKIKDKSSTSDRLTYYGHPCKIVAVYLCLYTYYFYLPLDKIHDIRSYNLVYLTNDMNYHINNIRA